MARINLPRAATNPTRVRAGSADYSIAELPTLCPRCRKLAIPSILGCATVSVYHEDGPPAYTLNVALKCPLCEGGYFAEYYAEADSFDGKLGEFSLESTAPMVEMPTPVSDVMLKMSSRFATVFDQAIAAEAYGLTEVCGAGYGRALEFLVKDYLISKNPEARKKIVGTPLRICIQQHIDNEEIRKLADQGVALRNDFVHYEDYTKGEIRELRGLINLIWRYIELNQQITIEAERLTNRGSQPSKL